MNRSTGLPAILLLAMAAGVFAQDASAPSADASYQDNVVIVLDASGSMAQHMQSAPGTTRMQAAKRALAEAIETIPEAANVGLLVFSAANVPSDWVYPLSRVDRAALREAVQLPEPQGDTPLGAYVKKAADRLLEERQKQQGYGTFRLLLVTDGEATDEALLAAYFPEVLGRGITVDVIGVDMKSDHTLATRAHSYRRADDPQALVQAVSEVFAEVGAQDSDDDIDEEQFAILEAIPDEVASAMLTALTTTGNEPIGESPGGQSSADGPIPATAGPAGTGRTAPSGVPPSSSGVGPAIAVVLLALFVAAAITVSIAMKALRNRT